MVDEDLSLTAAMVTLLLDKKGRLPRFDLYDCATRGWVLLDLARAGRLIQLDDAVEVDATPTGLQIMDDLSAAMLDGTCGTVSDAIARGPVDLGDLVTYMLASGCWKTDGVGWGGRRYEVMREDLVAVSRLSHKELKTSFPTIWCLLLCVGGIRRPPARPPQRIVEEAGGISWVLETVVDDLLRIQQGNEQTGWALRLS